MATAQEAATSIVASFTTSSSKSSNIYSFSWGKTILTGTAKEVVPLKYVLCYSLSEDLPTFTPQTGTPLFDQYNMELITELDGKTQSYQLLTTNLDFYSDATWGIYPLFNTEDGIVPGSMLFAKTFAATTNFNRAELYEPQAIAIDDKNNIYFRQAYEAGVAGDTLISKISSDKNLSHINGQPFVKTAINTAGIAYNNSTDGILTANIRAAQELKSNGSGSTSDYTGFTTGLSPVNDVFVWNNTNYATIGVGLNSYVNQAISGIVSMYGDIESLTFNAREAGVTKPSDDPETPQDEAKITYNGFQKFYDHTYSNLPQVVQEYAAVGLMTKNNSSLGLIVENNGTNMTVRSTSSLGWNFTSGTLSDVTIYSEQLQLGSQLAWGADSSNKKTIGTDDQFLNLNWLETAFARNIEDNCKGAVIDNYYYTASSKPATSSKLHKFNLLAMTNDGIPQIVETTNITVPNPTRVIVKKDSSNNQEIYILGSANANGSATILYKLATTWVSFAQVGANEYLNDVAWSSTDNCFYATYTNKSVTPNTYDIKKISTDGVITSFTVPETDGAGETKDTDDDFGVDFGGGTGGSGGGVDVKPPTDDGDIEVTIDDPEDPTLPGPYVDGVSPDDVFSLRKNRDILYILRNGIIIWTYKLTPRQLYNMTSDKYIGWINRTTGEPIATPEDAVYFNLDYSFDYTFNGTVEEPMASTDILFTYGKHYQGQSLIVWDDGQIKIDRFTLEEDLLTADYYVPGGRSFILPNGNKASSPLIPYWVLKLIVENNAQQYLVKVEDL